MPVIPLFADSSWHTVQPERTHSSFFAPEFTVDAGGAKRKVVNLNISAEKTNETGPKGTTTEHYEAKAVGR